MVLEKNFSYDVDQCSPIQEDFARKVQYDEDGNEFVVYAPIDYPSIQASHGSVMDWNLDVLLQAGINPNFPIHTGLNTRLEGVSTIEAAEMYAASLLGEDDSKVE